MLSINNSLFYYTYSIEEKYQKHLFIYNYKHYKPSFLLIIRLHVHYENLENPGRSMTW